MMERVSRLLRRRYAEQPRFDTGEADARLTLYPTSRRSTVGAVRSGRAALPAARTTHGGTREHHQ